jgi:transcriptional regulator with XRE-family HTH domain
MTPQEFKAMRKELGLSQSQLCLLWGMGANGGRTIRKWESGERPLNPIAARLIAYEVEALEGRTRLRNASGSSTSTTESKSTTS